MDRLLQKRLGTAADPHQHQHKRELQDKRTDPHSPCPERSVDPGFGAGAQTSDAGSTDIRRAYGGLSGIQQKAHSGQPPQDPSDGQIHAAAERGVQTSAQALPYLDKIQASFGRHDARQIQAHLGADASASASAMQARAYAAGDHVVFNGTPDLHTAAHEAAHVVQQRGGVQLKGGVGQVGDAYEQHADAVADAVVQGKSAEAMLDPYSKHSASAGERPPVQLVKDVFSPAVFNDPTSHLKGAASQNKVEEDPGSQGILGLPDKKLITLIATEEGRDKVWGNIVKKLRIYAGLKRRAVEDEKQADALHDHEAATAAAQAYKTAENNEIALQEISTALQRVVNHRTAATFVRQNTLRLSKLNLSPRHQHAPGKAVAGAEAHVFHRDAGLLKVDEKELSGNAGKRRDTAAALNGPFGTGFVRGHQSIDNMKHRFIEHIHVNKDDAARAIDIYNGTEAMGAQAEAWAATAAAADKKMENADNEAVAGVLKTASDKEDAYYTAEDKKVEDKAKKDEEAKAKKDEKDGGAKADEKDKKSDDKDKKGDGGTGGGGGGGGGSSSSSAAKPASQGKSAASNSKTRRQ